MTAKSKLVYGWGINDSTSPVVKTVRIGDKWKIVWACPYYAKWSKVIIRTKCSKWKATHPTYEACTVCDEWKYFSNFKKWVDSQPNKDWQNCELDKDLLFEGNKHYSPQTCVFLPKKVNSFLLTNEHIRGQCLIGVCQKKSNNKFQASCKNPFTGIKEYLGLFDTEIEAHLAWKKRKHELAKCLADLQIDQRAAKALREKYI